MSAPARRRSRFARLSRSLFTMAGGGAVAITLMACYGAGAVRGRTVQPRNDQCSPAMDKDRDGVCPPQDCDDSRADVYPGAPDALGDNVDQNCDGVDGIAGDPKPPPTAPKTRAVDPPPPTP